jgi:uncharacterized membrane protein
MPSRCDARVASRLAACIVCLAALAALGGCGTDTDPDCVRSFLRYDNFGAPFMANWCRSCHSAALPADMRQQAPVEINFDSVSDVRQWQTAIERSTTQTALMPPAGGPSFAEREMLVEWLRCGAPP